jgi:hypothetical protein
MSYTPEIRKEVVRAFSDEAALLKELGESLEKLADETTELIKLADKIAKTDEWSQKEKYDKFREEFIDKDLHIRIKIRNFLSNPGARKNLSPEVLQFLDGFFKQLGYIEEKVKKKN